jgi:sigma-E factor negative regulatory protein RseB
MRSAFFAVWISVLLLGGMAGQRLFADQSLQAGAKAWLTSMRQAMRTLNYQGVVVYLRDGIMESMRFYHAVAGGVEQERILGLNGPMREVIRDADKVTCYFPDTRTVFVEYKPPSRVYFVNLPEDFDTTKQYYDLNLQGQETIAQRLSQLISIDPKDRFRYSRKIWIDVDTKLPLKFELINEDGRVVEQMVFTSLTVEKSIPIEDLGATTKVDELTWNIHRHEAVDGDSLNWSLHNIPAGFQMASYTRLKQNSGDPSIEHIMLSDGFSSVSVYIDQLKDKAVKSQHKRIGAVSSYTRKVQNYLITVMGEVPEKTVQVIGDGLRYQGQEHASRK